MLYAAVVFFVFGVITLLSWLIGDSQDARLLFFGCLTGFIVTLFSGVFKSYD